jgi:hypothetical protein
MDSFQIIVLAIATAVLIIILAVLGVGMTNYSKKTPFPPIANNCPDFWQVGADRKTCKIPTMQEKNTGKIYLGGYIPFSATPGTNDYVPGFDVANSTIDFNNPEWILNRNSVCNKQLWANKYKITWDGVSNYNSC